MPYCSGEGGIVGLPEEAVPNRRTGTKKALVPIEDPRLLQGGATGNRTRDTRIFSPLLYQLSYGSFVVKNAVIQRFTHSSFATCFSLFVRFKRWFKQIVRLMNEVNYLKILQIQTKTAKNVRHNFPQFSPYLEYCVALLLIKTARTNFFKRSI